MFLIFQCVGTYFEMLGNGSPVAQTLRVALGMLIARGVYKACDQPIMSLWVLTSSEKTKTTLIAGHKTMALTLAYNMKPFNQWWNTFSSVFWEVDTQRMKYFRVIDTRHQMPPFQTATLLFLNVLKTGLWFLIRTLKMKTFISITIVVILLNESMVAFTPACCCRIDL